MTDKGKIKKLEGDNSSLTGKIHNQSNRITELEEQCKHANKLIQDQRNQLNMKDNEIKQLTEHIRTSTENYMKEVREYEKMLNRKDEVLVEVIKVLI